MNPPQAPYLENRNRFIIRYGGTGEQGSREAGRQGGQGEKERGRERNSQREREREWMRATAVL